MEVNLNDIPMPCKTENEQNEQNTLLDSSSIDSRVQCSDQNEPKEKPISKREQRRLLKHKRWLELKPIRRAKKKEKIRLKKAEGKLIRNIIPSRNELKNKKMIFSKCKLTVAVDFSFDHLMIQKDISKATKQLNFCYSINRRSQNPLQFHVTSFKGASKTEMQRNVGYTNWDVYFHEESFLNIFDKENMIYLTSDSENVITKLDENKVYIIGGLVDHNSHKGVCLKSAQELGICHGKLPIKEYLEMDTRDVLSIAHVFQILVLVASGVSWPEALMQVIPPRKGATVKSKRESSGIECKQEDIKLNAD